MSVDRKDLKPGDWIEVRDPNKRIAHGTDGAGAYKVVKVGRVNVVASIDVRFSPTGPWHHQEHKIPIGHIVRVIPPSEIAPAVEETKMATRKTTKTRENDEEVPPDAEAAGAQYAQDQLKSDYFANWILDQLYEASRMDPKDVLPLETKQDAMEIAKNMLQQLQWDTSRDLEPREIARLIGVDDTSREDVKEFFKGFRETLNMNRTWLADELLELKGQMRDGGVSEAKRKPRTGTPVRYKNDLFEVLAWDGDWRTKDQMYGHASGKQKGVFWTHDEARAFAEQFKTRNRPMSRDASVRISETLRSGDTTWHELWVGSSDGKTWEFAGEGRYADKRSGPRMAAPRVRDYIAVDRRDRPVGPRHKGYSDAKRDADNAGGTVKFVPSGAREGRRPKAVRSVPRRH